MGNLTLQISYAEKPIKLLKSPGKRKQELVCEHEYVAELG
jgi:hypothetical protein